MTQNGLKRKLAARRRVCGALIDLASEDLVELCGRVGFDFGLRSDHRVRAVRREPERRPPSF